MVEEEIGKELEMIEMNIIELNHKLREFLEQEARSCSMDFGCVTPLYVYRMWGSQFSIEEIENGLTEKRIWS